MVPGVRVAGAHAQNPPARRVTMDVEERRLSGLTVRIDRRICVGFETCIDVAPELFVLDEEGIATFASDPGGVLAELVLESCGSCPVDALEVVSGSGERVIPE